MPQLYYPAYKGVVFYNIEKNATTSIKKALGEDEGMEWIRGHERVPDHFITDRSFAFVRNPMDRLASSLRFLRRLHPDLTPGVMMDIVQDPNVWIESSGRIARIKRHCMPQTDLYYRLQLVNPDFIGRMENIEGEWKRICDGLKIIPENPLEHYNKSYEGEERPHWSEFIPRELFPRVIKTYFKDFKLLGYPLPE